MPVYFKNINLKYSASQTMNTRRCPNFFHTKGISLIFHLIQWELFRKQEGMNDLILRVEYHHLPFSPLNGNMKHLSLNFLLVNKIVSHGKNTLCFQKSIQPIKFQLLKLRTRLNLNWLSLNNKLVSSWIN